MLALNRVRGLSSIKIMLILASTSAAFFTASEVVACTCQTLDDLIVSVNTRVVLARKESARISSKTDEFRQRTNGASNDVKCKAVMDMAWLKDYPIEKITKKLGKPVEQLSEALTVSCKRELDESCKNSENPDAGEAAWVARFAFYSTEIESLGQAAQEVQRAADSLKPKIEELTATMNGISASVASATTGGQSCEQPADAREKWKNSPARRELVESRKALADEAAETKKKQLEAASSAPPTTSERPPESKVKPGSAGPAGATPTAPGGGSGSSPALAGAGSAETPLKAKPGKKGDVNTGEATTESKPPAAQARPADPVKVGTTGESGLPKTGSQAAAPPYGAAPATGASPGSSANANDKTSNAVPAKVVPANSGSNVATAQDAPKPFGIDTNSSDASTTPGNRSSRGGFIGKAIQVIGQVLGISANDSPQPQPQQMQFTNSGGSPSAQPGHVSGHLAGGGQPTGAYHGEQLSGGSRPPASGPIGSPQSRTIPSGMGNGSDPQAVKVKDGEIQKKSNYVYYKDGNAVTTGAASTSVPKNVANAITAQGGASEAGLAITASSSEEHPCKDLNSIECKQWKCEQTGENCPNKKLQVSDPKKKGVQIYEGEEVGGGSGGSSTLSEKIGAGLNSIAAALGARNAKKSTAVQAKEIGEASKSKSKDLPIAKPTVGSKTDVVSGGSELLLIKEAPKNDNRMNAPTWFKYLPKFLLDSSLLNAFFRTKSGRYIAGERIEIAHAHGDLFFNMNRAYASLGSTLTP